MGSRGRAGPPRPAETCQDWATQIIIAIVPLSAQDCGLQAPTALSCLHARDRAHNSFSGLPSRALSPAGLILPCSGLPGDTQQGSGTMQPPDMRSSCVLLCLTLSCLRGPRHHPGVQPQTAAWKGQRFLPFQGGWRRGLGGGDPVVVGTCCWPSYRVTTSWFAPGSFS